MLSATLSTRMCRRLYGEVWGVEGKGDRKPLGVCGWLTTGVVGAELLGTAVVALGIQFGAAPPHTKVGLTPVGAMEELTAEGRREIAILMSFFPPLRLGFIVADRKPVAPAFAIGSYATA
jgi:hypothetical protein